MDWDDLKFLLAVADAGGLAPAARSLGVDPSTVSRRIVALEKALDAELAERMPEGMSLTEAGRSVAEVARRFDAELLALAASMGGARGEPVGAVRVSTTDAFAPSLTAALRQEQVKDLVVGLSDLEFREVCIQGLRTWGKTPPGRTQVDLRELGYEVSRVWPQQEGHLA